jgi:chemotaxis signal transduction protein
VDWVRGVISLRGKIVPSTTSRRACTAPARGRRRAEDRHRRGGGQLAGVVVDDVAEVITVDDDQLERIPRPTRPRSTPSSSSTTA